MNVVVHCVLDLSWSYWCESVFMLC